MNLQIELGQISVLLNVTLRVIIGFIFLRYFLPLLIKEAKVRNGLRLLRYQLLFRDGIIFFIATNGLILVVLRYLGIDLRLMTEIATYVASFGFLVYFLIGIKMYRQRYSPENKKLHERFEKIENLAIKKAEEKK